MRLCHAPNTGSHRVRCAAELLYPFERFCLSRVTRPPAGQKYVVWSRVTEACAEDKFCVTPKFWPRWAQIWVAPLRGAETSRCVTPNLRGCRSAENEKSVTVTPWCRTVRKGTVLLTNNSISREFLVDQAGQVSKFPTRQALPAQQFTIFQLVNFTELINIEGKFLF